MSISTEHFRVIKLREIKTNGVLSEKWYKREFVQEQLPNGKWSEGELKDEFIKKVKYQQDIDATLCRREVYDYHVDTCEETGVVARERWLLAEASDRDVTVPVLHSEDGPAYVVRNPKTGQKVFEAEYTFGNEEPLEWNFDFP